MQAWDGSLEMGVPSPGRTGGALHHLCPVQVTGNQLGVNKLLFPYLYFEQNNKIWIIELSAQ